MPVPRLLIESDFPDPAPKNCWIYHNCMLVLAIPDASLTPASSYFPASRSPFVEMSCVKNLPLFCRSFFCQVSVRVDELKRCNVFLPLAGGGKRRVVCARAGLAGA